MQLARFIVFHRKITIFAKASNNQQAEQHLILQQLVYTLLDISQCGDLRVYIPVAAELNAT